jgi:hypothetical protein
VRGAPNQNNIASVHPKPFRIFFHANALLICFEVFVAWWNIFGHLQSSSQLAKRSPHWLHSLAVQAPDPCDMLAAEHPGCCCRRVTIARTYALSAYVADMQHLARICATLMSKCRSVSPLIHMLVYMLSTAYSLYAPQHRNDATSHPLF